jgi:ketosteroid isomerase-like protein
LKTQRELRERRIVMNKSMTVMAAAAILLSSSAYAQTVDTKADCNKSAEVWRTVYNNRDADALANLYDAKAGMYSGPFWTATGHDAILAGFKAEFKAGMSFAATITSRVCDHSSMTGATTVSDGTWTATMKGPDGKDVSLQGHWMSADETRDGKDVILVHVSNVQMPQPQAMK